MSYGKNEQEQVRKRLWAHGEWDLVFLDEVASTQDSTRELAASRRAKGIDPDKLIVVACNQTQGRGRQDHKWNQEPGSGISFSVLLRPEDQYPGLLLPILVAAAAWKPLELRLKNSLRIKWPNDLLIAEKKLCGILIESESSDSWICGVGINVNRLRFPPGLEATATSLRKELGQEQSRAEILGDVLETLASYVACAEQGNRLTVQQAFMEGTRLQHELVSVESCGEEFLGRLEEITPEGVALTARHFALGEVQAIRAIR
ncbi:MAG: biotin--[acetyl-CoA-carboxylase] ligase [Planctomycetota bacterium]|nr:MAG: biotin--[acetyl-CoA-carboxylase] ligase [Planctomycetota bacterium]